MGEHGGGAALFQLAAARGARGLSVGWSEREEGSGDFRVDNSVGSIGVWLEVFF